MDIMGKVMLGTGFLVTYGYFSEAWMAWYGHSLYEWGTTIERMFGPYGWSYWTLIFTNCVFPLTFLWSKKVRRSAFWMELICVSVLIGMWFERYVIVITLTREYIPSAWGRYAPTIWDYAAMIGSDRPVHVPVLPVPAVPADDLDHRDAGVPAARKQGGGRDGHA